MEVEIKFEPSGRNGVIAVGSYLSDAARRLGIELVDEYEGEGDYAANIIQIIKGGDLLSEPTKIEIEHLTPQRRSKGERLAGQAKIEKSGEIVVMVAKKKEAETAKEEAKMKDLKKEFADLPLEKKVANLLEMEAVTLSETFSFVLNSPFKIFEKAMDVMAEFGLKLEDEAKKAKRPDEHKTEADRAKTENSTSKTTAGKNSSQANNTAKKPSPRKTKAKPEAENTTKNN